MKKRPSATRPVTQEMIDLYDDYTHVSLDRRGFMEALTRLAGGAAAAAAALAVLENSYAEAAIIPEDDPRISAETAEFDGATGRLSGYLAKPAGASEPLPGVLVIHENRGLNPHIQDVARRVAVEGFVAFAPDFLSLVGGTPADEDQAREMIRALDAADISANALSAAAFLRAHRETTEAVGVVGFCWGGALANTLAVMDPNLRAAVSYYGGQPAAEDVAKIRAAVLLHYAGLDERVNKGIPAYEAALKAAGVDYRLFIYENVNHAFNNDTNAARYDKKAADEAWAHTIAFLIQTLG